MQLMKTLSEVGVVAHQLALKLRAAFEAFSWGMEEQYVWDICSTVVLYISGMDGWMGWDGSPHGVRYRAPYGAGANKKISDTLPVQQMQ